MKCKKVLKKLEAYIDGECDDKTEGMIRAHLSSCANCRKEYETSLKISGLLKTFEIEPDSRLVDKIFVKIDKEEDKKGTKVVFAQVFSYAFKIFALIFTFLSLYFGILSGNKLYEKLWAQKNVSNSDITAFFADDVQKDPFLTVFDEIDEVKNEK